MFVSLGVCGLHPGNAQVGLPLIPISSGGAGRRLPSGARVIAPARVTVLVAAFMAVRLWCASWCRSQLNVELSTSSSTKTIEILCLLASSYQKKTCQQHQVGFMLLKLDENAASMPFRDWSLLGSQPV